ncbi:hypothetical protein F4811DRAFT_549009 [Daldinia bambusicola]|nr:hypothetical protein F4811DRAFT_549009 [Daldinia bambusicola]
MSNDNTSGPSNDRRGSVTSAAFSNLFQRSNSTSTGNGNGRESVTSAAVRDQRRRLSVTTIGLSGTSPNSGSTPFGMRRGSISTNNSDSIDESAIDDEESAKIGPTSPFARRISFGAQAMRTLRTGPGSPGTTVPRPPQLLRDARAPLRQAIHYPSEPLLTYFLLGQTADTIGPSSLGPVPKVASKVIDRPSGLTDTAHHLTVVVNMIAPSRFPKCRPLLNKLPP